MKLPKIILLAAACVLLAGLPSRGQDTAPYTDFDPTIRFIFYSVLEGLYEDGVSTQDVAQILMRKEGQSYYHFIYACPICRTTIDALLTYQARPPHFYALKNPANTFGPGLSPELHRQLYSDDSRQRLAAINELMRGWMTRRLDAMHLPTPDRAALLEQLEKKRKEGMDALESFRRLEHGKDFGVAQAAPAYVDLEECAVCNGAVGKPMKLPEKAP